MGVGQFLSIVSEYLSNRRQHVRLDVKLWVRQLMEFRECSSVAF